MLAEMIESKGRSCPSPFASWARYCSLLIASSPRTAYWAETTCWLILLMSRLRMRGVLEKRRLERNGGIGREHIGPEMDGDRGIAVDEERQDMIRMFVDTL